MICARPLTTLLGIDQPLESDKQTDVQLQQADARASYLFRWITERPRPDFVQQ